MSEGTVRAKFVVNGVLDRGNGYGEVELSAVTGGSDENNDFWKYTPSGSLKMGIDNPSSLALFKPGQEYYLDFTPAPAE